LVNPYEKHFQKKMLKNYLENNQSNFAQNKRKEGKNRVKRQSKTTVD
jgi:hypothetical protein